MIIFICGIPGAGKTAKLTHFLVDRILNDGYSDYLKFKKESRKLEAGGFSEIELPPQHHLCYADYEVSVSKKQKAYYVDGFMIGLPNPFFKTISLPPYSTIFLDEAQRYYDSRMSRYIREEVYQWYQFHRHNDYTVFMACQRLTNIDVNIRSIGQRFICIDEIDVKEDNFGVVCKITWLGREFSSCECAEEYLMAKEKNIEKNIGKPFKSVCDFNIFNCYNSKSCKPFFYTGKYDRPYDYYSDSGYEFTLDSFVEFNNKHFYCAPQGYYKNADFDKKILNTYKGVVL